MRVVATMAPVAASDVASAPPTRGARGAGPPVGSRWLRAPRGRSRAWWRSSRVRSRRSGPVPLRRRRDRRAGRSGVAGRTALVEALVEPGLVAGLAVRWPWSAGAAGSVRLGSLDGRADRDGRAERAGGARGDDATSYRPGTPDPLARARWLVVRESVMAPTVASAACAVPVQALVSGCGLPDSPQSGAARRGAACWADLTSSRSRRPVPQQTKDPQMTTVTPREAEQVATANESGRQPVVFIHGLWLLAEQLGRRGAAVRGEGLRHRRRRLARRPCDVRRGARQPRGLRQEGRRPGRGPRRRGDR